MLHGIRVARPDDHPESENLAAAKTSMISLCCFQEPINILFVVGLTSLFKQNFFSLEKIVALSEYQLVIFQKIRHLN